MFNFAQDRGKIIRKLTSLHFISCPTNTEAEGWAYSPDSATLYRAGLGPGSKDLSLGTSTKSSPPDAQSSPSTNTSIGVRTIGRGQKQLGLALLLGKKATRPQPRVPQLPWSISWAGRPKGENWRKVAEEHQEIRCPTLVLLQAFVSNNSCFL